MDGRKDEVGAVSEPEVNTTQSQSDGVNSANQTSSSSGTGTTASSVETVPATQEITESLEEDYSQELPSWGTLYAIDKRFYPIELHEDTYTFGRDPDCSYCFDIPSIRSTPFFKQFSKRHFTIQRTVKSNGSHTVLLTDTSMNGVFVNGEKVPKSKSRPLKSNDQIAVASEKNRVLFFFDKTEEEDPNLPEAFKEKYIMHRMIGSGAFGEVRLAMSKFGVEQHAVKIINKQRTVFNSKDPKKVCEDVLKEAKLMLSLRHPNIITVHDVFNSSQSLYIVLELAPGGDLLTRILEKQMLRDSISKLIFYQMASAVAYLHASNITHRDLKPENILLMSDDDECLIKITDFGVSRLLEQTSCMRTQAGTPAYLAPELVKMMRGLNTGYTKQVDSWSMGVILYVCLVGYPPFAPDRKDTDQSITQQIIHANYNFKNARWSGISDDAKDLVRQIFELEPNKRLTPKQCLQHEWLKDETMRCKVENLTSLTYVATPSQNMSIINRIEGNNKEKSGDLDICFEKQEDDDISMSNAPSASNSAEKRRFSTDTSNESEKSNGDTDPVHSSEKYFASSTEDDPDMPKLQRLN